MEIEFQFHGSASELKVLMALIRNEPVKPVPTEERPVVEFSIGPVREQTP